jgi:hypothetical protein
MSTERPPTPETPGYRGALPPRNEWLARGWTLAVIGIFLAMFVLAALDVPSRFIPEPTPTPVPSATPVPSGTPAPSASGSPGASGSPAASASESETESPSPTP